MSQAEDTHDEDALEGARDTLRFRVLASESEALEALKLHAEAVISNDPRNKGYLPAVVLCRREGPPGFLTAATDDLSMESLVMLLHHLVEAGRHGDNPLVEITIASEALTVEFDNGTSREEVEDVHRRVQAKMLDPRSIGTEQVVILSYTQGQRTFVSHAPVMQEDEWRTLGAWQDEYMVDSEWTPGDNEPFEGLARRHPNS